jgi:hypothetical protein
MRKPNGRGNRAIADAVLGSIVIQLLTGRADATGPRVHGQLDILLRGLVA